MALTKKEVDIARLMINPEKVAFMDAVEKGDESVKGEIETFRARRLAELAVDRQVYLDRLAQIDIEEALLS